MDGAGNCCALFRGRLDLLMAAENAPRVRRGGTVRLAAVSREVPSGPQRFISRDGRTTGLGAGAGRRSTTVHRSGLRPRGSHGLAGSRHSSAAAGDAQLGPRIGPGGGARTISLPDTVDGSYQLRAF